MTISTIHHKFAINTPQATLEGSVDSDALLVLVLQYGTYISKTSKYYNNLLVRPLSLSIGHNRHFKESIRK